MRKTWRKKISASFAPVCLAATAMVSTTQESEANNICAGTACVPSETYFIEQLKLKDDAPVLRFEDTSASDRDWYIATNVNAAENFALIDSGSFTSPFVVAADAPTNSLTVDHLGHVGLGTQFPLADFHMVGGNTPTIRFEQDTSQTLPAQNGRLGGNHNGFSLVDETNGAVPISVIASSLNQYALVVTSGRIGINQPGPQSRLHIASTSNDGAIIVEENNAGSIPRSLLTLKNNGRPEIIMANTNTGGEWSFGAGSNFILKQGTVGSASSAKTKLFEIKPNGDATLTGSLTTGGTTCGGGCDLVFTGDYDLPSIRDHAEQMFSLGHLPNVGPTIENEPINVSDKLGRMLNELEHAHIYIAELEENVRRIPQIEADLARLVALEARLHDLEARTAD